MLIRPEAPGDAAAVRLVHVEAFRNHPFSRQTEHLIVDALRAADALAVSLVAEVDGEVVGHVAFSDARIGVAAGWSLLGPVGVRPAYQGRGIGRVLVEAGLAAVRAAGVEGCVLVGDPAFYARFGFAAAAGVTCPGVPNAYVLCLPLAGRVPRGEVWHHPAFAVGPE